MNILYCGMADDITTPILLVPNFTNLFVICKFDSAFALDGTWEGQKKDIINVLKAGNDRISQHTSVLDHYYKHRNMPAINYLIEPATNIEEKDNGKKWTVKFNYLNLKRKLIYYHHKDFTETWNKEIKDVEHLMCFGASFQTYNRPILKDMMKERTTKNCLFHIDEHRCEKSVPLFKFYTLRKKSCAFPLKEFDTLIEREREVHDKKYKSMLFEF